MRWFVWLIFMGGLLTGCVPVGNERPQVTFTPVTIAPPEENTAATLASPQRTVDPAGATLSVPNNPLPTKPVEKDGAPVTGPAATIAPGSPTARPTLLPGAWKNLAVLPELSPRALAIIRDGLARGYNPRAFSKIGDCESRTTWFLGDFDLGPKHYALGPYASDLQPVVDYYQGSFNRLSMAAKPGFTSASVMSLLWADREACNKDETPLACEYRLNKPILAFIMLGTNDASNPKTFEGHMRKIIEYSLSQGVLPLLGTKADNVEGDESINTTIARLAFEYDIPLWNYWRAVQDLPAHGLQSDGQHLTFGPTRFDDPDNLKNAWPVRNLNAMQILKMVMEQTQ